MHRCQCLLKSRLQQVVQMLWSMLWRNMPKKVLFKGNKFSAPLKMKHILQTSKRKLQSPSRNSTFTLLFVMCTYALLQTILESNVGQWMEEKIIQNTAETKLYCWQL